MKRIIVVGAGPAGMMAAAAAAECGGSVLLLEKMPRVGRKMMITGKGRCNVTSADDVPDLIKNIVGNGRFLNSSIRAFDNADVMAFFEGLGVPLKTERGNRVFPTSDRAADVVDAMLKYLRDQKVEIRTNVTVSAPIIEHGELCGVRLADGAEVEADAVILATGGASYPATGSTGDGYALAHGRAHSHANLSSTCPSCDAGNVGEGRAGAIPAERTREPVSRGEERAGLLRRDALYAFWRNGTDHPSTEPARFRAAYVRSEGAFASPEFEACADA